MTPAVRDRIIAVVFLIIGLMIIGLTWHTPIIGGNWHVASAWWPAAVCGSLVVLAAVLIICDLPWLGVLTVGVLTLFWAIGWFHPWATEIPVQSFVRTSDTAGFAVGYDGSCYDFRTNQLRKRPRASDCDDAGMVRSEYTGWFGTQKTSKFVILADSAAATGSQEAVDAILHSRNAYRLEVGLDPNDLVQYAPYQQLADTCDSQYSWNKDNAKAYRDLRPAPEPPAPVVGPDSATTPDQGLGVRGAGEMFIPLKPGQTLTHSYTTTQAEKWSLQNQPVPPKVITKVVYRRGKSQPTNVVILNTNNQETHNHNDNSKDHVHNKDCGCN